MKRQGGIGRKEQVQQKSKKLSDVTNIGLRK
jgi:hypothetical protein